jgi:hypothetical protein
MNREEALVKVNTKWWEERTDKEIVDFQLYEDRLCLPFSIFHASIEKVLNRSVWTHEFADMKGLQAEYEGKRSPETNPLDSLERILGRSKVI